MSPIDTHMTGTSSAQASPGAISPNDTTMTGMSPPRDPREVSPEHYIRFKVGNHIIKELGRGKAALVYASLSSTVARRILADYSNNTLSKLQTFNKLRANLVAVKIANGRKGTLQAQEIENLMNLQSGRTHIVKLLKADEQLGWMTLELLNGGTVGDLEETENIRWNTPPGTTNLPTSFAWHLIAESSIAFLEIHFGIINNVHHAASVKYAHNDIWDANLMFRYPGSYKDYPDLVLADLGDAVRIQEDDDADDMLQFYRRQSADARNLGVALKLVVQAIGDFQLTAAFEKLAGFRTRDEDVDDGNMRWLDMLQAVRSEARAKRAEFYLPLPSVRKARFCAKVVSDEELSSVFDELV